MDNLVEMWAQQIGWGIRKRNVIVEGESDVWLLELTRRLYLNKFGFDIFGSEFAVLSAGRGDDGGVDGVNRRLNTARQLAEADLTRSPSERYRFIALYDNDEAGRRALSRACGFDRRLKRYQDLFLLHPIMPFANGADGGVVEDRAIHLNKDHKSLDWEVEDLLSDDILTAFESSFPTAVLRRTSVGERTHREFTRDGKYRLRQFVQSYAQLQDLNDLLKLICALRNYLRLRHDQIVVY